MKFFKSLLIAPTTLGLLTPLSAISSEVDFQSISKYSNSEYEVNSNSFNYKSINNQTFLSGGEGLLESDSPDSPDSPDSFSSTTSASFFAEGILGGISTDLNFSEAVSLDYQYGIGLSSSFTGEDSLDVAIDVGGASGSASSVLFGMDTTDDFMIVDGITYSFPVGGATMLVGDSTDVSALYTGACAYGGFIDYMSDCGTGNSLGASGVGVTAAASYGFDGGFSIAGGVSSPAEEILGASDDVFGVEAAYTADDFGVAVAFSDAETATAVGVNGFYSFDFATISTGYETVDLDLFDDDFSTFFIGLTKEIGPGTAELGYASSDFFFGFPLVIDVDGTAYIYEASYAYPVNDVLTITPGIGIIDVEIGETTVAAVKASFSF